MSVAPAPRRELMTAMLVLRQYAIWNIEEVQDFLANHPVVSTVLLEAMPQIEQVFGKGTAVHLQVVHDHDDGTEELSARIQVPASVDTALAGRKRFNREWWMNSRGAVKGLLHFDVDCTSDAPSAI